MANKLLDFVNTLIEIYGGVPIGEKPTYVGGLFFPLSNEADELLPSTIQKLNNAKTTVKTDYADVNVENHWTRFSIPNGLPVDTGSFYGIIYNFWSPEEEPARGALETFLDTAGRTPSFVYKGNVTWGMPMIKDLLENRYQRSLQWMVEAGALGLWVVDYRNEIH